MSLEEMQEILGGILQVQRQLQENQLQAQTELSDLRSMLSSLQSIVNSNARSILANAEASDRRMTALENKLSQLIEIVGDFASATNHRLDALENQD